MNNVMLNLNNISSSSLDFSLFSGSRLCFNTSESIILGYSENSYFNSFIPYSITPSIINAQKTLNKMIDYLPENNPFKGFLLSKFSNLLNSLPNYTNILSKKDLIQNNLINDYYNIRDYSNLAGVSLFL